MIQPFDDSQFKADVARLRAYLAYCNAQLAHNRPSPPKRRVKAIDTALSKYQSKHIYLLAPGQHRNWQPSATRQGAPLWTTIEAA